jgi:hypothetical protein
LVAGVSQTLYVESKARAKNWRGGPPLTAGPGEIDVDGRGYIEFAELEVPRTRARQAAAPAALL